MISDKRPTGKGFGTPRLPRPQYGKTGTTTGLMTAFIISLVLLQGFVTYSVALTIIQNRVQTLESQESSYE